MLITMDIGDDFMVLFKDIDFDYSYQLPKIKKYIQYLINFATT
jgi:hypothetical protein|tara:strand:- start:9290 stop:9418 length:129 start_codon:yes stop_codon:yes gene_type:complete